MNWWLNILLGIIIGSTLFLALYVKILSDKWRYNLGFLNFISKAENHTLDYLEDKIREEKIMRIKFEEVRV